MFRPHKRQFQTIFLFSTSDPNRHFGATALQLLSTETEPRNVSVFQKKVGPRRHWVRCARFRTAKGESVSDLQALLGDMLEVTSEIAWQLRSMGGFSILQFLPRTGAGSDVPIMDCLNPLRQATGSVPSLGLNDTGAADALCPT